jgi:hypothetical protein
MLSNEEQDKLRRLADSARTTAARIESGELVPGTLLTFTAEGPHCAFGHALAGAGFPPPGRDVVDNGVALNAWLGLTPETYRPELDELFDRTGAVSTANDKGTAAELAAALRLLADEAQRLGATPVTLTDLYRVRDPVALAELNA